MLLAPDEAKGLEFDSVVVVEPAEIAEAPEHGMHALFVALTRCTNRLAIVHARPLPTVLGLGPADAVTEDAPEETAVPDPAADDDPGASHDPVAPDRLAGLGGRTEPDEPALPDTVAMAVPFPDDEPEAGVPLEADMRASDPWLPSTVAMPVPFPLDDDNDHVELADVEPAEVELGGGRAGGRRRRPGRGTRCTRRGGTTRRRVGDRRRPGVRRSDSSSSDSCGSPAPALADRVVVSTPAVDATIAAVVETMGELDHEIAAAVAGAVVDRLTRAVSASLLPLVAEEIARALALRVGGPVAPTAERDGTRTRHAAPTATVRADR